MLRLPISFDSFKYSAVWQLRFILLQYLLLVINKILLCTKEYCNKVFCILQHNVTMTEPLVDGEGYPRSDIDVYTIRHIRHEIICKCIYKLSFKYECYIINCFSDLFSTKSIEYPCKN